MFAANTLLPPPTISPIIPPPSAAPKSTNTRRISHLTFATSDEVGGLGRYLRTDPSKTQNPGSNPEKENPKKGEEQKPNSNRDDAKMKVISGSDNKKINGSDILTALQRVSARKAYIKRQQSRRKYLGRRSDPGLTSNRVLSYEKARPVEVRSEWAARLENLQKRIGEFLKF